MPLITLTTCKPQSADSKSVVLDAIHAALVSVGVPAADRVVRDHDLAGVGVAADEARCQMVGQQPHHRGAARADRVGVAGARRAVRIGDGD